MWHSIRPNASENGIGRIVSVAVDFAEEESFRDPSRIDYRIGPIAVACCTLRGGNVTRVSRFEFARPSGFWAWIHRIATAKSPINIVCQRSRLTLPAIGLFGQIDNGAIRLSWPSIRGGKDAPADGKLNHGLVVLSSPPTIIVGRLCTGSILRVLDVANWGVDHIDLGEPKTASETAEAIERVVTWLVGTVKQHSLGLFRWTLAGQAMAAWRHGRMGAKVVVHDERPIQELERAGFYGGRISVFYCFPILRAGDLLPQEPIVPPWGPIHQPHGPVYGVDVNGLFGACMKDCLYPRRLADWRVYGKDVWNGTLTEPEACIARVVIHTADETYPVKGSKDTEYPRGTYETVLAGPELAQAVRLGRVLKVGSWARYELADLFSGCIDEWWQARCAASGEYARLERRFWKRLPCSLYGKFSQRNQGWVAAPKVQSPGPWRQWYTVDQNGERMNAYRSIGPHVQVLEDGGPSPNSFCAISAFVTSNARLVMDRIRTVAREGHYYYQAVDSLYVSQAGYNRLVTANLINTDSLGLLKLEGRWDTAHFRAAGQYRLDTTETAAGRKGDAQKGPDGVWREVQVAALDEAIAEGRPPRAEGRLVRSVEAATNAGGRIQGSGWVWPFIRGLNATD